jgi:diguanylate cyclase (GGDEF)-like protein
MILRYVNRMGVSAAAVPMKPTLSAVEAFIAGRQRNLAFPTWLERTLEADTRARRAQRLRRSIPTILLTYNLYLVPDYLLVPDQFKLAVLLHALVVSPLIIATAWLMRDDSPRLLREGAAASIPLMMVAQILVTFSLTNSYDADHYQYFVLLVLLFTNTVQRLPFAFAVAVSCLIIAGHAAAVLLSGHLSGPATMIAIVGMCVAAYLTLVSNYYLERDARRGYLHTLRDRLRHAEVEIAARHDALTDLANRHYLGMRLEELWQRNNSTDARVAMVMLDIDHFKLFNDRYGHVAGDACIKRVSTCVRAVLRGGDDLAVRYGGEELLVVLPGLDEAEAARIAERIRRAVEALGIPHEALGPHGKVTVSCGAAAGPVPAIAADEMIAAADAALYAAKRNGRNQVWPPLMRAHELPRREAG